MKCVCLFLYVALSGSSVLWSQENVHQQLYQTALLEQQGQFGKVIEIAPRLIGSNLLDQGEVGRAWTILGFAYQEQGDFMQAESAYEHAIQKLSGDPKYEADYATALDNFADFYRDSGNLKLATTTGKKALAIYEKLNLHDAVARSCVNMAGLDLNQNHRHEAQAYLARAVQEAKLDSHLDDDFFASMSSAQAWFFTLSGDKRAAVSAYERAVELWRRQHGEENNLTGWGYLLLGNAYAHSGQEGIGLETMHKGLEILGRTLGTENPRYLAGEIAYSHLLEHTGAREEAARLKNTAEQALARLHQSQCLDCRISVATLR